MDRTPNVDRDDVRRLLRTALPAMRAALRIPVAFGGPVHPHTGELVITELYGALGDSLRNFPVSPGEGLGGRVTATRAPCLLDSYFQAEQITHLYDQAVAPEKLRAAFGVPVCVGDRLIAVMYGATRGTESIGDRAFTVAGAIAGQIIVRDFMRNHQIRHEAERLSRPPEQRRLGPGERRELHAELRAIASEVTDPALAERMRTLCDRVLPASDLSGPRFPPVTLSPRETQVLARVALGHTNTEIAERLGLLPETVKSYLRTIMRKLGVHTRTAAVHAAHEAGLLGPASRRLPD